MLRFRRSLQSLTHLLWPPVSTRALGPWLERYVHERARSVLGITGDQPILVTPLDTGRNTIVRRLVVPGLGVAYARAWRYDRLRRPAREHQLAGELFTRAGLRVPRLLLADDSIATLRRYRLEAAIEQAALGHPLAELYANPPAAEKLVNCIGRVANELARLHTAAPKEAPDVWGKPWWADNEMADPRRYWLGRLERLERRIPRALNLLDPAAVRKALGELASRVTQMAWVSPALVHGDFSPNHIFEADDGNLTWIDFGTVHYGHPAEDLAAALQWLRDPGHFDLFIDRYARAGGEAMNDKGTLAIDFFGRMRLWEKLSSRIVKRSGRADVGDDRKQRRIRDEQALIEEQLAWLSPELCPPTSSYGLQC